MRNRVPDRGRGFFMRGRRNGRALRRRTAPGSRAEQPQFF